MTQESAIEIQPVVMIIDDDDTTRMLANEFLVQAGFVVSEAADGLQALEQVEAVQPDIILLDVEMPRLDGFGTCARLRSLRCCRSTPILMLTGLHDTQSIDKAYEAGATDFATKPINWSLLCHRLRYMLRAHKALDQLGKSQLSLASAQRIAQLGNWTWNVEKETMEWSEQFYCMLSLEPGGLRPTLEAFLQKVHEEDRARVANWIQNATNTGNAASIDHRIVVANGSVRSVRQQVEADTNSSGEVILLQAAVQDITERRRAEEKIHQLAYFDGLTSLPNRELFKERLDHALILARRDGHSMAVLFLDLDNFKRVNDTLGHAIGDLLLNEVARRLEGSLRIGDTLSRGKSDEQKEIVARMGGDEFTVLLSVINEPDDAILVADRILDTISRPYNLAGNDVSTTPSVGIAVFPQDGDNAADLLKNADMAMYFAKRAGKNLYKTHDEAMDETAQKRYKLEAQLRKALERCELSLNYQPQMDLVTGEMDAVEALLRWSNAELGSVSPAEFIPIAEETGLIVPIGEWVIRTACAQAKSWRDEGLQLSRIAVNISVLQFIRPDFPALVAEILRDTGLEPEALELEITESLLATDTVGAVCILHSLKDIGVQLSIDDFGTGYSSLSQLKHFPIDRLKIDQSFIRGVISDSADAAIANAVIAMANSMKLRVVAEGVETKEQLSFLKSNNCDEAQGYFLSYPLNPEALGNLLRQIHNNQTTPFGAGLQNQIKRSGSSG